MQVSLGFTNTVVFSIHILLKLALFSLKIGLISIITGGFKPERNLSIYSETLH
jgi:hypothetical protein